MNHEIAIVCDGCVLAVPTNDAGLVLYTGMLRQALIDRRNGKEDYSILLNEMVLHSGDKVTQCTANSNDISGYYCRGATDTDLSSRQVQAQEKLTKIMEDEAKRVQESDKWKVDEDE